MKLLNIPLEKYNDVTYVLNWLKNNQTVGDENVEPIEYFHCFWKGQLSDLHVMSLQSLINTHPSAQIMLWTPNVFELNGSSVAIKLKKTYKNKIEINETDKNLFANADAELLYSQYSLMIGANNQASLAYASDIIRFIILQVYGGVWFDLDVLFLKDLNSIKIKRYVSQWGTDECGNAAILRLEKNHGLIKYIYKNFDKPFYPTTTFKLDNELDVTIIPSTFFDILWRPKEQVPETLQFKTWDEFFKIKCINLPEEVYAYHWHNRWSNQTPLFFNQKHE
jgi:hypothetical protein